MRFVAIEKQRSGSDLKLRCEKIKHIRRTKRGMIILENFILIFRLFIDTYLIKFWEHDIPRAHICLVP